MVDGIYDERFLVKHLISGTGKAICDGVEEKLSAGVMHIWHKGSEHTIINTGDYDLVMLTVVISRYISACRLVRYNGFYHNQFGFTVDIHSNVFRHVETVCLLTHKD